MHALKSTFIIVFTQVLVIGMYRIYIAVLHYGNTIVLYLILIVHLWDGPGI